MMEARMDHLKTYANMVFFHILGFAISVKFYMDGMYNVYEWVVYGIGFILAAWGQIYFTVYKKWSGLMTQPDEEMWEGGPFALVRHPFYGGLLIMLLSMAIAQCRVAYLNGYYISFLKYIAYYAILFFWARRMSLAQEEALLRTHGKQAERYFRKVKRRWIPFIF